MNLIVCSTGPLFFRALFVGWRLGGGVFNLCPSCGSQLWVNPVSRRLNKKWGRCCLICQTSCNCGEFWRQTPHLVTCQISYNWVFMSRIWDKMNIDCLLTAKMDGNPGTVYKLQNRKKTITQLLCFTLSVMRQQFLPHTERKTAMS